MNRNLKIMIIGFITSGLIVSGVYGVEASGEAKEAKEDKVTMGTPEISGHIESTLNWNLSQKGGKVKKQNTFRSYDAQPNTFNLNAAHVAINGETTNKKLSYTIEIDGGSDTLVNRDAAIGGGYVDLQEGYLTYQFTDWLSLTSGKFATFQGIEVIEGPDNATVSRGYLFGLAEAFTITGMYLELTPSDMISVKLGGVNDWDVMVDSNDLKTFVSQVGFDFGNPLSFAISTFVGGASAADFSVDLTGVTKISTLLDLNFQVIYGQLEVATGVGTNMTTSKWIGGGIQPIFHFSNTFDLGLRYELWKPDKYKSGQKDTLGNSVGVLAHNVTVAPMWKPMAGFMIRPELRVDFADKEVFFKNALTKSKTNITASLGTSVTF